MYIVFVVLTTTTTTPPPPPRFDLEGRCRTLFKEGSFGNGSEDTGHVKCRCLEKGFRQQAVCKVKMELWRGVVGQGAQVPDHSRNEIIQQERERKREKERDTSCQYLSFHLNLLFSLLLHTLSKTKGRMALLPLISLLDILQNFCGI